MEDFDVGLVESFELSLVHQYRYTLRRIFLPVLIVWKQIFLPLYEKSIPLIPLVEQPIAMQEAVPEATDVVNIPTILVEAGSHCPRSVHRLAHSIERPIESGLVIVLSVFLMIFSTRVQPYPEILESSLKYACQGNQTYSGVVVGEYFPHDVDKTSWIILSIPVTRHWVWPAPQNLIQMV